MNDKDNITAKELNDTGTGLLQDGKPEQALKYFKEAIECGGEMEVKSWLNKGLALKELGKFDEAIECFDKAQALEMKFKNSNNPSIQSKQINNEEKDEDSILKHLHLEQNEMDYVPDPVEELCHELDKINEFDPARIEIIETLGNFKSPKSIPTLLKAMETDYAIGRDKVAQMLSEMEVFEAIPVFKRLLSEDKDMNVRVSCAKSLGRLASKESMEVLLNALNDPEEEVRDQSLLALEQFEEETPVASRLKEYKKRKYFLARIKDEEDIEKILYEFEDDKLAEKVLIEALKDNDREDFNIIRALSFLKSVKAVEPLLRVLKDKNNPSDVRATAAIALGNLEDKRALDPLIKALKDNEEEIKCSAAEALGKLHERRAVESLIVALSNSSEKLREKIIEALSRIRHLPPLIKALGDKRDDIRLSAIEAIGKIKEDEAIKAVSKMINDEDRVIRNGALKALLKQEAFDELIKALTNPKTRDKSMEILISSGNDAVVGFLMKALENSKEEIRGSAAEILGKLKAKEAKTTILVLLNDQSREVRSQAIEALGRLEEIDILIKFMEDEPEFAPRVLEVLGIYGAEKSYETLLKSLKSNNSDARAQAVMGMGRIKSHKAPENIIDVLKDRDSKVRSSACRALGIINNEKCVEPLCKMLKDKEPSVRNAVKAALEQICLEASLRPIVITNLNKLCSFSITVLFSKEEKIAQKEAKELLKTIQVLNS